MEQNELLASVTEIKELETLSAEIQDRVEELKEKVKAYLTAQGQDKLFIGQYKVMYTPYTSTRFDSKTFKAEHEELYNQYSKKTEARRFSIS